MTPRKPEVKRLRDFKPGSVVILVDRLYRRWGVRIDQPHAIPAFGVVVVDPPDGFVELLDRKWLGLDPLLLAVKTKRKPQPDDPATEEWVVDLYPRDSGLPPIVLPDGLPPAPH